MNAAAFYILAAVVVAGAIAAVGFARPRDAAAGLLALTTAAGVLGMASGAYLTGVVEIVLPALAVLGVGYGLRRGGYAGLTAGRTTWIPAMIQPAAAAAAALLATLLVGFAGNAGSWHMGSGGAALLTLLHYRAPLALVAALLALLVGAGGALLLGRTGDDERAYDRTHEARRLREERAQRRREDRLAARRRRPAADDAP